MFSVRRGCAVMLAAIACLFAHAAPARAGALTLKAGEAKLFVTGLVTDGDHYFDSAGKLRSRGRYRKRDLQAYAEYGLTDRVTAFGSIALEKISTMDGTRSNRSGLGRSEAGLRVRVFEKGDWTGSVQSSAVIAGAKKSEGRAAIGESDDQFDIRGLVGRSFKLLGKPAFVDFEGGYRVRTGDPADEVRLDTTLGVRPVPRLLLMAQSFNTIGTKRWRGPYPLKQKILKVQGTALFDLTDVFSIYVAAFVTPIGVDALEERGVSVGLGCHF